LLSDSIPLHTWYCLFPFLRCPHKFRASIQQRQRRPCHDNSHPHSLLFFLGQNLGYLRTTRAPGDCKTPSVQQPLLGHNVSSVFHPSLNPPDSLPLDSEVVAAARSENASMIQDLRRTEFSEKIDLIKKEVDAKHIVVILDNSSFWPGKAWDGMVHYLGLIAAVSDQCNGVYGGIDIYIQNDRNRYAYGLTTPMEVNEFFAKVRPVAGDNTQGEGIPLIDRLDELAEFEKFNQLTPDGGKINEYRYYHIQGFTSGGEDRANAGWHYGCILSVSSVQTHSPICTHGEPLHQFVVRAFHGRLQLDTQNRAKNTGRKSFTRRGTRKFVHKQRSGRQASRIRLSEYV